MKLKRNAALIEESPYLSVDWYKKRRAGGGFLYPYSSEKASCLLNKTTDEKPETFRMDDESYKQS